jgi:hypothetical protein
LEPMDKSPMIVPFGQRKAQIVQFSFFPIYLTVIFRQITAVPGSEKKPRLAFLRKAAGKLSAKYRSKRFIVRSVLLFYIVQCRLSLRLVAKMVRQEDKIGAVNGIRCSLSRDDLRN